MSEFFLGVDAGNTKTIAAVADQHGNVIGWARGGLGDIYGVDAVEEATGEVLRLVDQALLAAAGIVGAPVAAAAFRLAGVDWPEDEQLWTGVLRTHLGPDVPLSVKNDGFALLRCGDPDGVGVAVSLGTGVAIAGRGRGGAEFAMSWWLQHPLGASGLVDDALHAIYQAEIGMAPETTLSEVIPRFYDAASTTDLLHAFTRRENPGGSHLQRSRAARVVLDEAETGDAVAVSIVRQHARRVAHYVSACAAKVGLHDDRFAVTLGGSVIARDNILRRATLDELASRLPHTVAVTKNAVPIVGTILDALAEGGTTLGTTVRDNVLHWEHGL